MATAFLRHAKRTLRGEIFDAHERSDRAEFFPERRRGKTVPEMAHFEQYRPGRMAEASRWGSAHRSFAPSDSMRCSSFVCRS
jgi:hypothetical protein